MQTLIQDLRYGARMLVKNSGFTLIAIITLALGIGANTAIFSLTNALVLRPFDFPDLDRLVTVSGTMPQQGSGFFGLAPADYADLRRQQTVFVDLAAYRQSNATLTGVGEPERVFAAEERLVGDQRLGRRGTGDPHAHGFARQGSEVRARLAMVSVGLEPIGAEGAGPKYPHGSAVPGVMPRSGSSASR